MGWLEAVDRSIAPLASGLDRRARRHTAIAANIANADTPRYKTVDVSFSKALADASLPMATTHPHHLSDGAPRGEDTLIFTGGEPRRDGNDVDVDREMVKLAQNQIEYQFLTRSLGGRFRKLKEAITGRASP